MSEVRIVGVRHHSPACARLVAETIRELRPAHVLIEGPADMTPRLDELLLPHRLPIAIFSYYRHEERTHASWSPLCDYSPEWVALREGRGAGAEVRFIDLPAWTHAFVGVKNRYSDRGRDRLDYVATLCRKLGVDGLDALWDHLFEQPMALDVLRARLDAYFEALRAAEGGPASEADALRESFMARHVAHAARDADGPVVVVCGGFHAPALARMWPAIEEPGPPEPPIPDASARHGSYLVPYSFGRLDAFTGYEAGMPSPGYYQALWEHGPRVAGERMLELAVRRVRAKKQPLSAADLIAAETMTRGLMRLRGHRAVSRTDLLDGLAAALLKEPCSVPLPWTQRGPLRAGTDPILIVVLATLCGKRRGELAPDTPRPPLLADARAQLELHGLTPGARDTEVTLDLVLEPQRAASRVLHRLRVLSIPGFTRLRGPRRVTDGELTERWQLAWSLDTDSALVEAAAFGATLEAAAAARLEEKVAGANGDLEVLTEVLTEALFVGLPTLARRLVEEARRQVHLEPHLARLGAALAILLALYRHDTLLGGAGAPEVGSVIEEMVARGLWLFEGRRGTSAPTSPRELSAVIALRDAERDAGSSLEIDGEAARAVMRRRAIDPEAPPGMRGAALGYLWSTAGFDDDEQALEHAVLAARRASQPTVIGEWLAGLFALARSEVVRSPRLVSTIDDILSHQTQAEFLLAVPSLRLAFGWFPPRERDAIARTVLELHGEVDRSAARLRSLPVDAETMGRAIALESRVTEIERRFGLDP